MSIKPLRILYVTSYYKPAYVYGGPTRSVSSLCEAMVKSGCQVEVFTTNANGRSRLSVALEQPIDVDGVTVTYFPLALNGLHYFFSPRLASAIKSQVTRVDLVVVEALWSHAMMPTAVACSRSNRPYVVALRGQLLPWSLKQKRWRKIAYLFLGGRRYLNRAVALHCTDPVEADEAVKLGLCSPAFVVPNGIDTSRFSLLPERDSFRQRLSIPLDATILLFLGRLHRKKRPDLAIEALATAQSLNRQVYLVVAGPDQEQLTPKLQSQAKRLGCNDNVRFVGLLKGDDVLLALSDADLLMMPSEPQSENFGMSAVEAMAAGVPVLASDDVPVGRWAAEGRAGRIVPCSAEDFSRATLEMLSDPEKLKEMGERGQELAQQRFDILAVAQQMLAQYESIVTNGRPLPDKQ